MASRIYLEKRRYEPRLPAHLPAKIITPNYACGIPCIILEISPAGAKIELGERWLMLPNRCWLTLEGDGCMHQCHVVWHEGSEAGVQVADSQLQSWWDHGRAHAHLRRGHP